MNTTEMGQQFLPPEIQERIDEGAMTSPHLFALRNALRRVQTQEEALTVLGQTVLAMYGAVEAANEAALRTITNSSCPARIVVTQAEMEKALYGQ